MKSLLIVLSGLICSAGSFAQTPDTLFFQDWESGIGSWFASNGVWEVGIPMVGPSSTHSGQRCVATILNGNYPSGSNTRLESPISPQIVLPSVSPPEKILLKFWHWFRNWNDNGSIQISVNGGSWQTINNPLITGTSNAWTQYVADLSLFANSTIRIGFLFQSGTFDNDNGWYIDDILVVKKVSLLNNPEDFEAGVGDWGADNGVWQVGVPTVGPPNAYSSLNCAGTMLNANYPSSKSSRLISPEIDIIPLQGQSPILFFWHWFRLWNDAGRVQISVNHGAWQTVAGPFSGTSPVWTQAPPVDLSAYADSSVRIAFYFQSGTFDNDNGWYIDDIRIEGIQDPTSIGEVHFQVVTGFELSQNYPNPFNPTTAIRYQLPKSGSVELTIYNLLGQEIRKLVNENRIAGQYTVQWDGRDETGAAVASGVYLYRLKAGEPSGGSPGVAQGFVETKKMLLLR